MHAHRSLSCTHTVFPTPGLCGGATCISSRSRTRSNRKPNGVPLHLLQVTGGPRTGEGCVGSRPAAARRALWGRAAVRAAWPLPAAGQPSRPAPCGSLETACSRVLADNPGNKYFMSDKCPFDSETERGSADPLRALGGRASPHPGAPWGFGRTVVRGEVLLRQGTSRRLVLARCPPFTLSLSEC